LAAPRFKLKLETLLPHGYLLGAKDKAEGVEKTHAASTSCSGQDCAHAAGPHAHSDRSSIRDGPYIIGLARVKALGGGNAIRHCVAHQGEHIIARYDARVVEATSLAGAGLQSILEYAWLLLLCVLSRR
jgi:hypothetical protein